MSERVSVRASERVSESVSERVSERERASERERERGRTSEREPSPLEPLGPFEQLEPFGPLEASMMPGTGPPGSGGCDPFDPFDPPEFLRYVGRSVQWWVGVWELGLGVWRLCFRVCLGIVVLGLYRRRRLEDSCFGRCSWRFASHTNTWCRV